MTSKPGQHTCPLCAQKDTHHYHSDRRRGYYLCPACSLVFVPAFEHISAAQEKARYDRHKNDIHDAGYRDFVSRVLTPLSKHILPPAWGLDFGCGPGPALADMAQKAGYHMSLFDPFYAPNHQIWTRSYDFITCTEVVEHLRRPGVTLPRVWSLLRPGGWMGIMTKLVHNQAAFAQWHYIRDETHVSFFSQATFEWLADHLSARVIFYGRDIIFLHKVV